MASNVPTVPHGWSLGMARMLRSALAPGSTLELGEGARLLPGDVICLGTPGGVALTITTTKMIG